MTEAIKKNGINFGIILGIFLIIKTVIMYAVSLDLFLNSWLGFLRMLVIIGLGIFAVVKAKHALNSYITFKEAFTAYFITIVIGILCYTLIIIALFNVIDTEAGQALNDKFLEAKLEMMKMFSNDSKLMRETIEQDKKMPTLSIVSQLMGLGVSIIGYSLVGLIVAAIMKKNKPEFQ